MVGHRAPNIASTQAELMADMALEVGWEVTATLLRPKHLLLKVANTQGAKMDRRGACWPESCKSSLRRRSRSEDR